MNETLHFHTTLINYDVYWRLKVIAMVGTGKENNLRVSKRVALLHAARGFSKKSPKIKYYGYLRVGWRKQERNCFRLREHFRFCIRSTVYGLRSAV